MPEGTTDPKSMYLPLPTQNRPADLVTVVAQTVAVGFGAVALLADVLLRAAAGSSEALTGQASAGRPAPFQASAADLVDAALGAGWGLARIGGRVGQTGMRVTGPLLSLALDPPLLPRSLHPSELLQRAGRTWREQRRGPSDALLGWSSRGASDAVALALRSVDIDQVLWAVVDELDMDATIARLIDGVDVDAAARAVVDALDLDAVAALVVDGLDLNRVILSSLAEVDLDAVASSLVARLDLDQVTAQVLAGLDVAALVDQAMARVDLTAIVLERADLARIVNEALDSLDLTQLVMQRVDLAAIADYVIDAIDLPEIVRGSTNTLAAETVREIRLQSVDADRAVSRVADRLLLRKRRRRTAAVDVLGPDPVHGTVGAEDAGEPAGPDSSGSS